MLCCRASPARPPLLAPPCQLLPTPLFSCACIPANQAYKSSPNPKPAGRLALLPTKGELGELWQQLTAWASQE